MILAHNMMALNAQRVYGLNTSEKAKSTEKLSSGYKINRAADDAAGLTISEKMRSQIRGLNQGSDNIQDGISVCQIMDGALEESQEILHRMTELTIKASNGTLTTEDRDAIQKEINQLTLELDRTTESTTFNTKQLLAATDEVLPGNPKGGKADIVFAVDISGSMGGMIRNVVDNLTSFGNSLSKCNVNYSFIQYTDEDDQTDGAQLDDYPFCEATPFTSSLTDFKTALSNHKMSNGGDGPEAALEAIMKATKYSFRDDATKEIILVTDADFHVKGDNGYLSSDPVYQYTTDDVKNALSAKKVNLNVITQTGYYGAYGSMDPSMLVDIDSNFSEALSAIAKKIAENAGETIHKSPEDIPIQLSNKIDDEIIVHTYNVTTKTLGLTDVDCTTQESAKKQIEKIDKALSFVSSVRSNIGADQNKLEHAYRNNTNKAENTTAAESRIRDTDMAAMMAKLSKENILSQVGEAMMAQANQSTQGVLNLLA